MQKKFIALAVAGLVSGAAFAQSNVTVYGVADLSFDVVSTTDAKVSANNVGSRNRVSANSSYLGFKGTEALGNGLNAVFQFETGVAADGGSTAGATPGPLFAATGIRDTFAGLSGGFGTVVLGNLTGPTRALGAAIDVNAGATGNGFAGALLGKLGGNTLTGLTNAGNALACTASSTCTSVFDTRWAQAVAYVSPNFAGFQGTAAYVANENRTSDGTLAANQANPSGYDLGVTYNNGPIMGGLTFAKANTKNALDSSVSNLRLAGSYNFGVASVRALWERTKLDSAPAGFAQFGTLTTTDLRADKYGLGVTYNVTPAGKILAQWYHAADVKGTNVANNTSANFYELGYEHSLSKRTMLIASYQRLNNSDNANYDFGINAAGSTTAAGAASAIGVGTDVSSFKVGIRHSF